MKYYHIEKNISVGHEMRGLFMSLVIHYWIGDVQDCQGVSASEITYIVTSGALNSTHSPRGSPNHMIGVIMLTVM